MRIFKFDFVFKVFNLILKCIIHLGRETARLIAYSSVNGSYRTITLEICIIRTSAMRIVRLRMSALLVSRVFRRNLLIGHGFPSCACFMTYGSFQVVRFCFL